MQATPMPSSLPSVVPLAFSHSPSILGLLRHHIHVCLHRADLTVLEAGRSGLVHHDVVATVLVGIDATLLCPVEQELLDLFEVSARARYLGEFVEVAEDCFRLKVMNSHRHVGFNDLTIIGLMGQIGPMGS